MLTLLFASFTAFAAPAPASNFQMCVQTCQATIDQPGWELRQCVTQCERLYLPKDVYVLNLNDPRCLTEPQLCWLPPKMMKPLKLKKQSEPRWCETYEEDCERPSSEIDEPLDEERDENCGYDEEGEYCGF